MRKNLLFLILTAFAFTSCKKDKGSDIDRMRDTVYMYAKEFYLWNDALPDSKTFGPRQFTSSTDLASLQLEIDALSQLKINNTTGKPFEYNPNSPGSSKYSYVDQGQAATAVGGTGTDFGLGLTYVALDDLRVRYVYPGSSAATQNIARGDKVTTVNDEPVTRTSGTTSDAAYIRVSNAIRNNTIKLGLTRQNGTTYTATLNRGSYTINPVIKSTVITTATGKKVGYFAFSRFTTLENASARIDAAFSYFAGQNVTEMVVDLRYNGGGALETAEYLSNYLVPSSKSGSLMFTEYYNTNMQTGNIPLFKRKYRVPDGFFSIAQNTYNFAKKGTLNLNRVFFLVSGSTASASEVVINVLQPAMPQGVQIIGRTTYGKPVGFYGLPLGNASQYDVYLAQSELRNAQGKADYYLGMVPGGNFQGVVIDDDITKDFGDPAEGMFARALNFIDKGTYTIAGLRSSAPENNTENEQLRQANQLLDAEQQFSGAVHTKDLKRFNH